MLSPVMAAMASSGRGADFRDVGWAALAVLVWTVVKFFLGIVAASGAPWWLQVLDRVGSAVAGAVIAVVPEDLHGIDWALTGWSALGAAGMALIMFYGTPPSKGVAAGHGPEHLAA